MLGPALSLADVAAAPSLTARERTEDLESYLAADNIHLSSDLLDCIDEIVLPRAHGHGQHRRKHVEDASAGRRVPSPLAT
jgi:hypothetical protein